jgi:hypothetical protein
MIMAEQPTQGVPAQPAAPTAQPAPIAPQPEAPVAQPGFNAAPTPNGFVPQAPAPAPEPIAPVQPAQPAVDNTRTTEQFSKLTDSNQRLAQQNDLLRQELNNLQQQRQQNQQQFAPVQQVPAVQGQQPSALPKLSDYVEVDPQTGERFVNEAKFNNAMSDIYQKASRAEEVVKNYVQTAEQREIERQEREAFAVYPELNPRSGQFDQRLSQQTRAIIYDSMINPHEYGGRPLSFKDAADFVSNGSGRAQAPAQPPVTAVPTPAVHAENQVQKEQAAVSVPHVPQQVTQNVDADRAYAQLVQGTRTGHDDALAIRLKNATHLAADVDRQGIS